MSHEYVIFEVINGVPLTLLSSPGIFSKKELDLGTRVLLENIKLAESGIVADVGCGYGPIGIYLALKNPNLKVYMVDVNYIAIKLAKKNAKLNGVENRTIILKSDIFDNVPVDVKFNAIYSNPPLSKGVDFLKKLEDQSYDRLVEKGFLQLVAYKGEENIEKIFGKRFKIESIKRKKGYSLITIVKD
ncbi:class I SAM-dependent methyltransferase [Saccharolobus islandicus]|uniref:16S RNA G1207 methylase RsmC n=1 Tax=Saccharolobus islandicus LAL14/1 TaxID=1241935 RepID=M9UAA6_SACIS|nr:methyltransferase [Sulfolobus islandicus]AGJ63047.1 16S RNA G1207 methylase RsmC [Sulfolobus islandicus LAL14/1]